MSRRLKLSIKISIFLAPLLILLIYRYLTTAISLTDTNVYFYTAYQMLQGRSLYSDIIFTNLPLFPLVSVLYFLLTKGGLHLFYFTAAVEGFILTLLIFYAVYTDTRKFLPSLISSFLFSFSVYNLANSGTQTGIFTASIFAVSSYIFIRKKKPFLAGFLMSLCFLTKAYFVPALGSLVVLSAVSFKKRQLLALLGGLVAGAIPLIPFLLESASEMHQQLFGFSLRRGTGIDKFAEAGTFLSFDFIFPLLLPFMLLYKKFNRIFWIALVTLFLLFFLYFADFYYLYFGMIVPFLSIRAGHLSSWVFSRTKSEDTKILILMFLSGLIFFNLLRYSSSVDAFKVYSIDKIVRQIKEINPDYIYGKNIALAVSYLTEKPMIEGVVDTNALLFMSGFIDKDKITQEVVNNKTVVITHGFERPGQTGTALPDIVNTDLFHKHCSQEASYPVVGRPPINRIVLFSCLK